MGLFKAIVKMSARHGITHWYAVMEPTLLRLLARFGIEFDLIGPLVQYHGWRQPCFAAADQVLAGIHRRRPEVWEFITDAGKLWPAPRLPSALRR
jgi:N-acyl amino acid synthase of PEP-CTERM/exosortase system